MRVLVFGLLLCASVTAADASGLPTLKPGDAGPIGMIGTPGEKVELAPYAVKGKTTVFDFYSEFCPPCRAIAPELARLTSKRKDVIVRKIDINRPGHKGIDWSSPVAKQHDLHGVPHFVIHGTDGAKSAEGEPAYEEIVKMINALGK